jgi:predicted nucleic acid-binding protein
MTVYVESNFVLEQALQQEQCDACNAILDLAAVGRVSLVVPAFSLAEPHQALALKEKTRNRLSNELQAHISELGRSKAYRAVPDDFRSLVGILIRSAEQEREGLQGAITGLLDTAAVISLNSAILRSALELQTDLGMSGQDAIVLASVLEHLQSNSPTENCFLSRNSRDFDDPDVRDRLDRFGCRYFARLDQALPFIEVRSGTV